MPFPHPGATRAEIDAFLRERGAHPDGTIILTLNPAVINGVPQKEPLKVEFPPHLARDLEAKLRAQGFEFRWPKP